MEYSDKARQARNAYAREYRRKNPDKIRKHQQDYWERQADKVMNDPGFHAKQLAKRGYTQREIAAALDVSLGTVNRLLNTE